MYGRLGATSNGNSIDVKISDGAALVHKLDPKKSNTKVTTFDYYANQVFLPYVANELQFVSRLDVVWDVYNSNRSLK